MNLPEKIDHYRTQIDTVLELFLHLLRSLRYTCQGLEMNYIGVIFGPDFKIRDGEVITNVDERYSYDASIRGIKKMRKENPEKAEALAERIIKNTYRTLMTRGMKGCYIYCTDKETEEYFRDRM